MPERKGQFTVTLSSRPTILGYAAVAGKKEGEGPLGRYFDYIFEDTTLGEKTWEKAESALQREAFTRALDKAGLSPSQVNYLFAGDLLNQSIASTFGLREYNVPLFGQFGACSTMAQTLAMSSIFVDSGAADLCCAVTSSHFCTAERQFRFPLEYGGQRPPSAQWTVTGSGAFIVSSEKGSASGGADVEIADAMAGISVDYGINDANDMGAAMAPAAYSTLDRYFRATGSRGADYDLIVTGDLGRRGSELFSALCSEGGYDISRCRADCGELIYDIEAQDKHSGGSGCGCSAAVMASYIVPGMRARRYSNVLFIGTGALMNPQALMQGENIVGIAHLVHLRISD